MKTKTFPSASRLAVMALACIFTLSFTACGGDDDEPTVDELLSEETTPITFALENSGTHFLYDYAGRHLVESQKINAERRTSTATVDLRQGKHRLVWLMGLTGARIGDYSTVEGVDYDPETGMVTCKEDGISTFALPQYCIREIEVTPYLMPEQKLDYKPLCATLSIELEYLAADGDVPDIIIKNVPSVASVGIDDNRCDRNIIKECQAEYLPIMSYADPSLRYKGIQRDILCPKDGIDDVQIEIETHGSNKIIKLPKIRLRRGCEVTVSGPLVGNSVDDYKVEYYER